MLAGWFAGDRAKGLDGTLESRDLKWCRDDVSVVDRLQQEPKTPYCGAAGIDSLGRGQFTGFRHHFLIGTDFGRRRRNDGIASAYFVTPRATEAASRHASPQNGRRFESRRAAGP